MRTLRLPRLAAAALVVTTLSGTAASAAIGSSTPAGAASLPSCNLKALANHKGVVDITFWESASRPTSRCSKASPVRSTRRNPRCT